MGGAREWRREALGELVLGSCTARVYDWGMPSSPLQTAQLQPCGHFLLNPWVSIRLPTWPVGPQTSQAFCTQAAVQQPSKESDVGRGPVPACHQGGLN